jgi:hypothetical protein
VTGKVREGTADALPGASLAGFTYLAYMPLGGGGAIAGEPFAPLRSLAEAPAPALTHGA